MLTLLAGCGSVDVGEYANNTPRLDLFNYFQGNTKGWGIVQDRNGKLLRQFVVDINGTINQQGELVLDEAFHWNDGEKSQRIWTIARSGDDRFSGRAADVVGEAVGVTAGNALHWQYHLDLVVDGRTWKVHFNDWMFLQPNQVLINRAAMSKFGFGLGEVTIMFRKADS